MPINNRIAEFTDEMTVWRHHIHQHPETAFEEHKTSDYVALRLHEFGIDVHRERVNLHVENRDAFHSAAGADRRQSRRVRIGE